jgi:hypothetical protein
LISETALTALQSAIEPLLSQGRLIAVRSQGAPNSLIASESLEQASAHLLRELGRMNGEPISRAELRSKTVLSDWVFDLALRPLLANEAVQSEQDGLRLAAFSGKPSAQDPHLAQVEELYIRAGLASPILSEVSEQDRNLFRGSAAPAHPAALGEEAGTHGGRQSVHSLQMR